MKNSSVVAISTILCCFSSADALAAADTSGFSPKILADYMYDSNLFRVSGTSEARSQLGTSDPSDNVFRVGLGADYKLPLSQQLFTVSGNVIRHKYDAFDFLDHTSGSGLASWDWKYGSRFDGDIRFKYVRDILTFEELNEPVLDKRDLFDLFGSGNYMLTPHTQLHLAAARSEQTHSRQDQDFLDRTVDRYISELRYTSARKSYVGLKAVVRLADFPNREVTNNQQQKQDNSYTEYEYSVTINWVESATSRLWGRLGATRREHDEVSDRDFEGATWRVNYDWNPRARFGADFAYWRDLDAYADLVSSYVEETGGSVQAWWALTSKVRLKANVSRMNRDYDGDPGIVNTATPSRHDRLFAYGAGVDYAFRDRITFTLDYRNGNRDSNIDDREYDYYSILASVIAAF